MLFFASFQQIDSASPSVNLSVLEDVMETGTPAVKFHKRDVGSGVRTVDVYYQQGVYLFELSLSVYLPTCQSAVFIHSVSNIFLTNWMLQILTNGTTRLLDPHKLITNFLNTYSVSPQSLSLLQRRANARNDSYKPNLTGGKTYHANRC